MVKFAQVDASEAQASSTGGAKFTDAELAPYKAQVEWLIANPGKAVKLDLEPTDNDATEETRFRHACKAVNPGKALDFGRRWGAGRTDDKGKAKRPTEMYVTLRDWAPKDDEREAKIKQHAKDAHAAAKAKADAAKADAAAAAGKGTGKGSK